jgi:hypothetical protein
MAQHLLLIQPISIQAKQSKIKAAFLSSVKEAEASSEEEEEDEV